MPFDAAPLGSVVAAASSKQAVVDHALTARDWIVAGIIFAGGILLGRVTRSLLARAVRRGDSERSAADVVGRMVGYAVFIGAIVYCLAVLGIRLGPLVGALGIGGLAIAFAAQTILANFLASIILQIRRPFRRGDQISTNDREGVVEDVNFRTVVIRTYEGERVMVPCASVLNNPITNHTTLGRRRTTLDVGVGYDSDPEDACRVIIEAITGLPGVLATPAPEVWVESFGDSAVNLAVRFWHAPDIATLWRVRSSVAVATKRALDAAGIDIPFPQVVLAQVLEPSER
jgi:small-conductance mechanosensitive channel